MNTKTLLTLQRGARRLTPALLLAISFAGPLLSQSAQLVGIKPLYFTMPGGGPNPQAQTLTVTSTGSALTFDHTVTTVSGGNWLQVTTGSGCGLFGTCTTPAVLSVGVDATSLPAGVYTGSILLTNGTVSSTVQVTLTVAATTGAFFGGFPGQLGFVFAGGAASAPLPQTVQIGNAGSGQLNWSVAVSTAAGGNWLTVSAQKGVAPSMITANVSATGLSPATYTGQLLFQAATGNVTVPVSLVVSDGSTNEFNQVPGLSFTMPAGGPNPLAQALPVTSTSPGLSFDHTLATASGGNWLQVTAGSGCSLFGTCATPAVLSVSVNATALTAGVYTGSIMLSNGTANTTVPVTLTVAPTTEAFFGELAGQLSFVFAEGAASAPLPQTVQIGNAGSGQLNWSVAVSTAADGNWLTVSAQKGVAPSTITVSVSTEGLSPGTYAGQLLFQAATGNVSVPVSLLVASSGTNEFNQAPGLGFTMPAGGPNPLAQAFTVTSTAPGLIFSHSVETVSGGDWLQVGTGSGCSLFGTCTTPAVLSVTVDAANLPAGVYSGSIMLSNGTANSTVPVTLTVAATTEAFFGDFASQLGFVFGGGSAPAPLPQTVQIANAGPGQLNWTVVASTATGGSWLSVSAQKGVAPSTITVSVSTKDLEPGTYTGQLLFQAATGSVTVPVSLVVAASSTNEFKQVPSLSFTMPEGGPDPKAQTFTLASTNSGLSFGHTVQTVAGGNWLQVSTGSGCSTSAGCSTPAVLSVSVDAAKLPGGTYTGALVLTTDTTALTVPVTLTITGGPSINAGGVVNDASYAGGASMAAGSIAAVFGNFLITSVAQFTTLPLPASLAGVSLEFDGGTLAPLYFVSGGQVNIQVPWELAGQPQATLTATVNGLPSPAQFVSLAPFDPGIFSTNSQGTGQGAILDNATYLLVDSSNPATAGSTYIQIYCTGLGAVTNQPADGAMALSDPLSWSTTAPTATIGGIPATVVFYGLAPGFVGLYQVNAQVPATAPAGNAVPVVIMIGDVPSNTVTIAVH